MALVRSGFPLLLFAQDDETRARRRRSWRAELARAARRRVCIAGAAVAGATDAADVSVPTRSSSRCCSRRASIGWSTRCRWRAVHDPDRPPHLNKVTETV